MSEIRPVRCPFCDSPDAELMALFGQALLTSQYYCRNCRSVFEAVRWSEAETGADESSPHEDQD